MPALLASTRNPCCQRRFAGSENGRNRRGIRPKKDFAGGSPELAGGLQVLNQGPHLTERIKVFRLSGLGVSRLNPPSVEVGLAPRFQPFSECLPCLGVTLGNTKTACKFCRGEQRSGIVPFAVASIQPSPLRYSANSRNRCSASMAAIQFSSRQAFRTAMFLAH